MSKNSSSPEYTIKRAAQSPSLEEGWDGPSWNKANTIAIKNWYPKNVEHRPETEAKVLYDTSGLYVMFRVRDRYVRAVTTDYQGPVCTDSCVEFFVEPREGKGYFNFEINCIGTLLLCYIEDPTRTADGFVKYTKIPKELGSLVQIRSSLKGPLSEELTEPTEWTLAYHVPWKVLESYVGPIGDPAGQTWRANFFKCGDKTSHPHWGTWSPIGEQLNFHQPRYFKPVFIEP
ncbi:MAG: carbohydrate-binding family 9-like protein [Candidatus Hydrogenedentes bacterium]|nr:carbohydrate-binding family 9-like protein [Candidatus Hydrogenedentota bacterium]